MQTKYATYKEIDFLTDDYFIKSMLRPTPESDTFWQVLVEKELVDEDEFLAAYMTCKHLHENKQEIPVDRIDVVWERLNETKRKQRKARHTRKLLRYVAAACVIGLLAILPYSLFLKNQPNETILSVADIAIQDDVAATPQLEKHIQLSSADGTVNLDGTEASIVYEEDGMMKINDQTVKAAQQKPVEYQLAVPYGKRASLTLPDGTLLWVNSGSTVSFPSVFTGDTRKIGVEGEVFADVFPDKSKPFIIATDKLDVHVLGTTFNLSAYQDSEETAVVLVSGSVEVAPKTGEVTKIRPNQLFAYTKHESTVKDVNVEEYISWRDGRYIFWNEPIENVLLKLSRYYDVNMLLPTSSSGITCSGKLELKEDLDKLLGGLAEVTSMTYTNKDNEYRIRFDP